MMRLWILFLLLTVSAPLQAGVKGDVRQGGKLYAQEKYGEALSHYEKALRADPQNAQAQFGAGAAAYYLKEKGVPLTMNYLGIAMFKMFPILANPNSNLALYSSFSFSINP